MNQRWVIITAALVVDAAIMFVVLRAVLAKKGVLQLFSAGLDKAQALAAEARDLCGNYVRANYSGNPDDLPTVLEQLMTELDQRAKEKGMTFDRPVLKLVLAQAIRPEDGVKPGDLQAALRKVA